MVSNTLRFGTITDARDTADLREVTVTIISPRLESKPTTQIATCLAMATRLSFAEQVS